MDYPTLKIIWWLLVGVLLVGFAVMDGHDMGVGTLLPFVGKSDLERRVVINTVGPHWDGNQVWFVTGGGAKPCITKENEPEVISSFAAASCPAGRAGFLVIYLPSHGQEPALSH